ncbi:MAG: hypothetical protein F6K09_03710 [Merismopedia sp. SIO2A8]|nr:hypothetical protein [Merismopedia sp. SIO2A8]
MSHTPASACVASCLVDVVLRRRKMDISSHLIWAVKAIAPDGSVPIVAASS